MAFLSFPQFFVSVNNINIIYFFPSAPPGKNLDVRREDRLDGQRLQPAVGFPRAEPDMGAIKPAGSGTVRRGGSLGTCGSAAPGGQRPAHASAVWPLPALWLRQPRARVQPW